ncbi:MAG: NUDIX domain-containing protein [Candidatus Daviesbacteria bacterium]|nr:NUDIX domain-containing protein [Candidatus Daviesbacteria bacterium]
MKDDQLLFVGQKAFIDRKGEILILVDPKLGVDLPGGKIKEDENDLREALKREVREETGLEIEIGDPFITWMIEFPKDHRNQGKVFLVGYRCKYISGDVTLSDEHSEYRWVNKENYKKFCVDGHYKAVEKYFT